jgi:hypothetical protein
MSTHKKVRTFVEQADLGQQSFLVEVFEWLQYNKKWWLAPIVLILMLVGFLVILSGTAVAPFIYTLF